MKENTTTALEMLGAYTALPAGDRDLITQLYPGPTI